MRATTLLSKILGLKKIRVRDMTFDDEGLVVDVAPSTRVPRCSGCHCRVRGVHDRYEGRRWRHLDVGPFRVWLRYAMRRVRCPRCGVLRHRSLATHCFQTLGAPTSHNCSWTKPLRGSFAAQDAVAAESDARIRRRRGSVT
jgi:transposase